MASFRARGVKGLGEGSLGFREGPSSRGSAWAPSCPLRSVPGTPIPTAAHTQGAQVQLPAPRVLQGLLLDPPFMEKEELPWWDPDGPGFESCFSPHSSCAQVFVGASPHR